MNWLLPASVATAAGVFSLALASTYLYLQYREKFMGIWALAWGVLFCRYLFMIWGILAGDSFATKAGYFLATLLSALLLLRGVRLFVGKSVRWWAPVVGAGIGLWVVIALTLELPPLYLHVPVFEFLGVIDVYCGVTLLKAHRNKQERVNRLVGWLFILWGIHQADYPLLRPVVWFAPWGYLIGATLAFSIAVGLIIAHFERLQKVLQSVIIETAGLKNELLLRKIVETIANIFRTRFVLVARVSPDQQTFSTLTFLADGQWRETFVYPLAGSPCGQTFHQDFCFYPHGVAAQFPEDQLLRDMHIDGYMASCLYDGSGVPVGILAVFDDKPLHPTPIDSAVFKYFAARAAAEIVRGELEQSVHSSEERYRSLYDKSPVMMHSIDDSGSIVSVSDLWLSTLGYRRGEVIGHRSTEFLTPESRQYAVEDVLPAFYRDGFCWDVPYQFIRKDGTGIDVLLSAIAERDDHGNIVKSLAVLTDITGQKSAEKLLGSTKEQLEKITQTTRDAILMMDPEGNISFWNPAAERVFGYCAEEAHGKNLHLLLATECYLPEQQTAFPEFQRSGIGNAIGKNLELTARRKDGQEIEIDVSLSSFNLNGEWHAVGILRDITERKRIDRDLRASELYLRMAVESGQVGLWRWDVSSGQLEWNPRLWEIFGLSGSSDPLTFDRFVSAIHPDDVEQTLAAVAAALGDRTLFRHEYRIVWPDGTLHWVAATGQGDYAEDGKAVSMVGSGIDITQRKATEEHLRNSEEKFSKAFLGNPLMMTISDLDTGRYTEVNETFCEVSGFDREAVLGRTSLELGWIQPDDRRDMVADLVTHGQIMGREIALTGKSGRRIWCQYFGEVIETNNGKILLSIAQDITQSRREEQRLAAELRLTSFSSDPTAGELMQKFLDEAEVLTESSIGFFHLVDADQETLRLMAWSTNTLATMCTAEGEGTHYPISHAGIWVDCVKERRPLIHNDYASLPNRKGLPPGHAPVARELVVPVYRNEKLVAILGVGNKKGYYDEDDVKIVQRLAEIAWETVIRKHMQEALAESEELYRVLVNTIPLGIMLIDQDYRIIKINNALAALFQRPPEWFIGRHCSEVFEKHEHPCPHCPGEVSLKTGEVAHAEARWARDDGCRIWVRLHTAPVKLPNGSIGLIEVVEEVSEQRELEAKTQQMARLSALGEMASGVAHEINNPIAGILNCAELLKDRLPAGDRCHEIAARITRESDRIAKIVRSLLSIARPSQNHWEWLAVGECVDSVLSLSRNKLIKSDIDLRIDIPDGLPRIFAERQQIEQVLLNLLNNSHYALNKRFPDKHPDKLISITARDSAATSGDSIRLEVYDQGTGVRAEQLGKVFDPFFTTKPAGEGTGLGMGLCHEIIRAHGGEIRLESEFGKFTRVTVELPAAGADTS